MNRLVVAAFSVAWLAPALAVAVPAFGPETTSTVRGEVDARGTAPSGDGAYGRFDGDLDLGVGAGAVYEAAGEHVTPALRASAHYFSTAGVTIDYADTLGREDEPRRRLGLGVDVRPLFIPRWATASQGGPAALDLALDSLSLGLGAYFGQPGGEAFGDERGFTASLGFGVPLSGAAPGPWLELRGGLDFPDEGETRASVLALLSFHWFALTPLSSPE